MKAEIGAVGIVLLLLGAFILVSNVQQNGGLQLGSISYSDISKCRIGETEYITLRCEVSGDPISLNIHNSPSGSLFTVNTVETSITAVVQTGSDGVTSLIVKDSLGIEQCRKTNSVNTCIGKPLIKGVTYTLFRECGLFGCFSDQPQSYITITGRALFIKVYVPQIGIQGKTLPSSQNCIDQRVTSDLENIGISLGIIDSSVPNSVTMQQGQETVISRGVYRELLPITAVNYNGNAAVCEFVPKKIYGFDQVSSTKDGGCIAIKGSVLVDISTRSLPCCTSSECSAVYGKDSSWNCVDFGCQQVPGTDQCLVDSDCEGYGQRFIDNSDGSTTMITGGCVSRKCETSTQSVSCNPTRSYSNNQCCKRDGSNYRLDFCTQPLLACDQLGADACCLPTQNTYTLKPAPEGKYCCDKESDGIGSVTENKAVCDGFGTGACEAWNIPCHIGNAVRSLTELLGMAALVIGGVILLWLILNFMPRR